MIGIVDYGMGNLGSVSNALRFLGVDFKLIQTPEKIKEVDRLILPGVGSFGKAITNLHQYQLYGPIKQYIQEGKPFLGICLGLQLLFENSQESPDAKGLGVLKGDVIRFDHRKIRKVPHMGWNRIETKDENSLLHSFNGEYVYFVHSYYALPNETTQLTQCQYQSSFCAAIEKENLLACQFHPEKSGEIGIKILRKWVLGT